MMITHTRPEKRDRVRRVLIGNTLATVAMAISLSLVPAANAAAQGSCISNVEGPPGLVYPMFDWRLSNHGELPQIYGWRAWEDGIEIRVEDGTPQNVAPNEMLITLVTSFYGWRQKEIVAWNTLGYLWSKSVSTPGPFDGAIVPADGIFRRSMRITKTSCYSTTHTIVFRKFKGLMVDMYHLDPNNFWTLWAGKRVTITWFSDDTGDSRYPPQCETPCIPVGTLAPVTPATKVVGDFDGDGLDDIALTGVPGWSSVPVAFSNGDGSFRTSNRLIADFAGWAAQPGVKVHVGHFRALLGFRGQKIPDRRAAIALTGGAGWGSLPVAFSNGDGTFLVKNLFIGDFAGWAAQPGVKAHLGDFNNDGLTDIALTGGVGWNTLPVAFSNGDGSFTVTNPFVGDFAGWAAQPGVMVHVGRFNVGGGDDIALTGGAGWNTLPVAFSNMNGSFTVTNRFIGDFAGWAAQPGVTSLVANFNRDGTADIALTGGLGWRSLPVAHSNGDGSFNVTNHEFFGDAIAARAREVLVGDFDGDGLADIAFSGVNYYPLVAYSSGDGTFQTGYHFAEVALDFASWSMAPWATKLMGDFNGDGKIDIALTGAFGWNTLPIAFSGSRGDPIVTNTFIGDFATFSSR